MKNRSGTNASIKNRSSESVPLKKRSTAILIHCSWSFFERYSFIWWILETHSFTWSVFHGKDRFVGIKIYNNLGAGHILISPTVFGIQGFEKSQEKKIKIPVILGKYCPDCAVRGQKRSPSLAPLYLYRALVQNISQRKGGLWSTHYQCVLNSLHPKKRTHSHETDPRRYQDFSALEVFFGDISKPTVAPIQTCKQNRLWQWDSPILQAPETLRNKGGWNLRDVTEAQCRQKKKKKRFLLPMRCPRSALIFIVFQE